MGKSFAPGLDARSASAKAKHWMCLMQAICNCLTYLDRVIRPPWTLPLVLLPLLNGHCVPPGRQAPVRKLRSSARMWIPASRSTPANAWTNSARTHRMGNCRKLRQAMQIAQPVLSATRAVAHNARQYWAKVIRRLAAQCRGSAHATCGLRTRALVREWSTAPFEKWRLRFGKLLRQADGKCACCWIRGPDGVDTPPCPELCANFLTVLLCAKTRRQSASWIAAEAALSAQGPAGRDDIRNFRPPGSRSWSAPIVGGDAVWVQATGERAACRSRIAWTCLYAAIAVKLMICLRWAPGMKADCRLPWRLLRLGGRPRRVCRIRSCRSNKPGHEARPRSVMPP